MNILSDLVKSGVTIEQILAAISASTGSEFGGSGLYTLNIPGVGKSQAAYQPRFSSAAEGFWVIITAATKDGSNFRWTYTWSEAEKTATGFSGWAAKSGGLTGSAYNTVEYANGASGAFGNGVNSTNLTGTFELKPVPTSQPVFVRPVAVGSTTEYWFSYENGVDGACP